MTHQVLKPGRSHLLICSVITALQHMPYILLHIGGAQLTPGRRLIMQTIQHMLPRRSICQLSVDGTRIQIMSIPHHFDNLDLFQRDPGIASSNFSGVRIHLRTVTALLTEHLSPRHRLLCPIQPIAGDRGDPDALPLQPPPSLVP